jgi:hypothetical protein
MRVFEFKSSPLSAVMRVFKFNSNCPPRVGCVPPPPLVWVSVGAEPLSHWQTARLVCFPSLSAMLSLLLCCTSPFYPGLTVSRQNTSLHTSPLGILNRRYHPSDEESQRGWPVQRAAMPERRLFFLFTLLRFTPPTPHLSREARRETGSNSAPQPRCALSATSRRMSCTSRRTFLFFLLHSSCHPFLSPWPAAHLLSSLFRASCCAAMPPRPRPASLRPCQMAFVVSGLS